MTQSKPPEPISERARELAHDVDHNADNPHLLALIQAALTAERSDALGDQAEVMRQMREALRELLTHFLPHRFTDARAALALADALDKR